MKTSPRSIGRWVLGICALAGALIPMTSASALSYPPGPGNEPIVAGSTFTVSFACVIGESVEFSFNGDVEVVPCSGPAAQASAQISVQGSAQATATGVASASFQAPNTPGVYILTIVAGGVTYTLEVVVEGRPGGGGGGIGGGIGTGGGLPRTGFDSLAMTLASGVAAVVTGAGVFAVAKRRSRQRLVV